MPCEIFHATLMWFFALAIFGTYDLFGNFLFLLIDVVSL